MKTQEISYFNSTDDSEIAWYHWKTKSSQKPKAILQIVHGISEYAQRYEEMITYFLKRNFDVVSHDHRAHGNTALKQGELGTYPGGDFWKLSLSDILYVTKKAQSIHPDCPIILFGHSMGSLMVRKLIATHGNLYEAVILSGTADFFTVLGPIGLKALQGLIKVKGEQATSPHASNLFFYQLNRPFKPTRTAIDWLSRDNKKVDDFLADPLRVQNYHLGILLGLAKGTQEANSKEIIEKTPSDLPLLLISGEADPVGEMGKGVKKVFKNYKKAKKNVELKLYPGARHEMMNETNRDEFFEDLELWMERFI